jgi:hypothetical protein
MGIIIILAIQSISVTNVKESAGILHDGSYREDSVTLKRPRKIAPLDHKCNVGKRSYDLQEPRFGQVQSIDYNIHAHILHRLSG